jgi:hypothetical protein
VTRAVAATLLVVGAVAAAGCGRAEHSEPASFADVVAAIDAAGLRVCDETRTEARSPGAVEEHRYDVAFDCGDEGEEDAVVVATAYADREDRDGAARRFEVPAAFAHGALWTLGPLTVRVSGERDRSAVDALTETLEDRGAE